MMNEAKMNELTQAEDMAYFRADLCCYSPESYTLEEKKEISNDMMATSKAVLDAMREDFEQLPPDARAKLLDMLCASGVESPQWWWDVLVGDGPPPVPGWEQYLRRTVLALTVACAVAFRVAVAVAGRQDDAPQRVKGAHSRARREHARVQVVL